jgi:5'-methylthioadenosine phosphorylase
VRMFGQWGGDVVGMTGLPEVIFAREAGICYAAVAIVTNFAAGLATDPVSHQDVLHVMAGQAARVRDLLLHAAGRIPVDSNCRCGLS